MPSTIFNLASEDKYTYTIDSNIVLIIERHSHSIARMYFSDADSVPIRIPDGLIVKTRIQRLDLNRRNSQTNSSWEFITSAPIDRFNHMMCYTEHYEVFYKGKLVLNMEPQRSWKISFNEMV